MKNPTFEHAFQMFVYDKRAMGRSEKTLETYIHQYNVIKKYLPPTTRMDQISDRTIKRVVNDLVNTGVRVNTVRSYTATLQTFFSWCRVNGLSKVIVTLYKGEETVPELYTKDELQKLLKKPGRNCTFVEYRTWVIINLLVSNGIRAATVRAIQVRDVHLDNSVILLRHTKRRKAMSIPLSPELVKILAKYLQIWTGGPEAPLFPDMEGKPLTENGLRLSVARYNKSRGVEKTSIHMFRHTFARMYLVDLHGDALKLQRLLGHSTLKMTQHYVQLFDQDLITDFQANNPLKELSTKKPKKIKMPPTE